jgi:hypothetical protein
MAYYAANRHLERVVPEAVQAVQTAYRKGYAVGLVTSKNREELQLSLPKLQLDAFVDTIVTSDDTERHKPNPDPVLKALRTLAGRPCTGDLHRRHGVRHQLRARGRRAGRRRRVGRSSARRPTRGAARLLFRNACRPVGVGRATARDREPCQGERRRFPNRKRARRSNRRWHRRRHRLRRGGRLHADDARKPPKPKPRRSRKRGRPPTKRP